jgi:carbamoyl-phosphate synthase large subunit
MEPITVIVTAVGGGGVGEQIVKALRLASTPYRIIGTDMSPYSKGFGNVDQAELVPAAKNPDFIPFLIGLCERYQARAVFCGAEAELRVLDQHREVFAARNILLPVNPSSVLETCLDKVKTAAFLASNGFASPVYARISSRQQLAEFDRLPAVVKPSQGGGGSANIFLAQTREELQFFGAYLLGLYPEFIVQEYVGTPETEFTVGILTGMDGVFCNSIAVRRHILGSMSNRIKERNRSGRDELGPVLAISNGFSQGDIGPYPEVTGTCEKIASRLGSRGPLNIQCRLAGDTVYVFEINPRFSGTTSLRAMVGYNEPDVLFRWHVLRETIEPRFHYLSGTIVRGLCEHLLDADLLKKMITPKAVI